MGSVAMKYPNIDNDDAFDKAVRGTHYTDVLLGLAGAFASVIRDTWRVDPCLDDALTGLANGMADAMDDFRATIKARDAAIKAYKHDYDSV